MRTIVLDLSSSALPDAARYLEGTVKPPSNYKAPEAIANYIAEKQAERLAMAAVDIDLAKITALGFALDSIDAIDVRVCRDEKDERLLIEDLAELVKGARIITYGGNFFDIPLVMRRARYLGIPFPRISLERFNKNADAPVDLIDILSDRDPSRRKSLGFMVKRLGWTDLTKILSGSEEAQVPNTGRWDDLEASIRHDIHATYRLAVWLGVIPPPVKGPVDIGLPF